MKRLIINYGLASKQKNQRKRAAAKAGNVPLRIVNKLTQGGIRSLDPLEKQFYQEITQHPHFSDKTEVELNEILHNLLNFLSTGFGFQSTMVASDRDVSEIDLNSDPLLQSVLNAIRSGEYKVKSPEDLKQLLCKIPCAFISAGSNPNDPSTKCKDALAEYEKLKADLASPANKHHPAFSYIEVDGYYDGAEKSFMVILNQQLKTKTFREFIESPEVKRLIEFARSYNQDSVLLQWGAAQFYYYPDKGTFKYIEDKFVPLEFNKTKDCVRYGEGFTIYDVNKDSPLPDNYYTEMSQDEQEKGKLRFQLDINFDHSYNLNLFEILCEHKLKNRFSDYHRVGQNIPRTHEKQVRRQLIMMRGADGINEAAVMLRREFLMNGVKSVHIVGSDAFIADLNKQGITNFDQIKPAMIAANKAAMAELLNNSDAKIIIFADLCKRNHEYPTWFGEAASEKGVESIIWKIDDSLEQCHLSYQLRHQIELAKNTDSVVTQNTKLVIPIIDNKESVLKHCLSHTQSRHINLGV